MTLRIGMVVGECSGDQLGAALITALRERDTEVTVEGILGEQLIALGGSSLFDMHHLSVMGFIEPLKRLPTLLHIRRQIIQHFIDHPPDVFIGVDAPDFNLTIERVLKSKGVKVVHYVSPSAWAWRKYRIKKIKRSVDLLLTLFPFEAAVFEQQNVPVAFVGHPIADQIPMQPDQARARADLGIENGKHKLVALLPGSRVSEIHFLAPCMLQAASLLQQKHSDLHFLVPVISDALKQQIIKMQQQLAPNLSIQFVTGQARLVLNAADWVCSTAGTATFEAMCFHKPMVIVYRTNRLNYALAKWLVDLDFIGLPNLLFNEAVAPELIQKAATPEKLAAALEQWINDPVASAAIAQRFAEKHQALQCQAGSRAAQCIMGLLSKG